MRVTGLGTLASRALGMIRDMATASLLGLSQDGVMDAFVIAFRIPNLFRRLFGEGALVASYVPVLMARLEESRVAAWRLASVTLVWLAVTLAGVVVLAEGVCAALAWWQGGSAKASLLLGLSAVMLPYLFFICLAAQLSGTLQALEHFSMPALAPTLLNLCWLAAIWLVAPRLDWSKEAQAYVLAVSVLVAGVLQLVAHAPVLYALGFRFDYNWAASRDAVWQILRSMGPMVFGLAITQINTFLDSLLAWLLSAPSDGPQTADWLGGLTYPLTSGAAAAIYFGERLYQFPLGLLGMGVAIVIFPALSRHAARGQHARLARDLTLGLRLVVFFGVPAGAGLMLLAEPLARLLFERGEFTADDAARVARMIACYGVGVWAFCAAPVVVRGYYALGDQRTPLRAGLAAMAANLLFNLALLWPLAEAGLALSTSLAAMLQVGLLLVWFSRQRSPIAWRDLAGAALNAVLATSAMLAAGLATRWAIGPGDEGWRRLAEVLGPLASGGGAFFLAAWLLKAPEPGWLLRRAPVEDSGA